MTWKNDVIAPLARGGRWASFRRRPLPRFASGRVIAPFKDTNGSALVSYGGWTSYILEAASSMLASGLPIIWGLAVCIYLFSRKPCQKAWASPNVWSILPQWRSVPLPGRWSYIGQRSRSSLPLTQRAWSVIYFEPRRRKSWNLWHRRIPGGAWGWLWPERSRQLMPEAGPLESCTRESTIA